MQQGNPSNQLKLISRDRRREFNDIRQSHSRRKDLSHSQLSKSVGKSRITRQFQNARETSRFTNIQNQESRCLKQIKQPQYNQGSRSHRDLMCPCCYNKKEAEYKQQRRNHERQIEQEKNKEMKISMIQTNLQKQLQYENHLKQNIEEMTQYNKRLMEKRQHQKMEEQNLKKLEGEMVKIERENFQMEKENKAKCSQQIRQLLKQKYEEQMRIKEEKQNMQKQMNRSFDQQNLIIDAIVPGKHEPDRNTVEAMRIAYKQDLLRQMQEREMKKKREMEDLKGLSPQKQVPEFQLVTFAEKRNQQAKRIAQELKQNQLKAINEKKNREQLSKQQREIERIQKERQRQKIIAETQAEKMHEEEARRQKIDNYLSDLKGQIEQNKKKRLQEMQWLNERKFAEPIIKPQEIRELDKDSCKGCHKKYPKKMLSEFVTMMD